MADRKIIAVVGATGSQGGGLVRAILADKSGAFGVRAITRDASSEKAQALARSGAEVFGANVDDAGSLTQALAGCYGAYFVTFFWDHLSPERERTQAQNMARAAKAAGVKHAIWSTLEDTRKFVPLSDQRMPTLMGQYKVPHFDAKGESDRFFIELSVPTTFLLTTFYWDNLIHFGMGPRRGADGKLALSLPMGDKKLAGIAAEDIGKCALGVFRQGASAIGETIGIAGGHPTGAQMAAALARALGEDVRYVPMSLDAYRKLGFPGADDLANMFQFYAEFERDFCASRDLAASRALNPELQDFETWVTRNAARIPRS